MALSHADTMTNQTDTTMTEMLSTQLDRYAERMGHRLEPKAVFFDMDGVLYDSMPWHEKSWLETARRYALDMDRHDVYMMEGQTGRQTIDCLMQRTYGRSATEDEIADIYELKTRLFTEYNLGKTIPNVEEVLAKVSALRCIIVTGSSQPSLLERIEAYFPKMFAPADVITGRDVKHGKPHPEPYLMAQRRAKVQPYESIVVENAPRGVQAAHTAGCFTIAVNTGPLDDAVLWEHGADLVVPDMATLSQVLPVILGL